MSTAPGDETPYGDDLDDALRRLLHEQPTSTHGRPRIRPIDEVPVGRIGGFELDDWVREIPASVAYVPAATVPSCIGMRVILALGNGWRENLRAASNAQLDEEGQLGLELLPEHDWHLRSIFPDYDPLRIFAPMETLRVEVLVGSSNTRSEVHEAEQPISLTATWLLRVDACVDNSLPLKPPRRPREVPWLPGHRLVLAGPEGFTRDVRATSEPFRDEAGEVVVSYLSEAAWYQWQHRKAKTQFHRVEYVWVE